MKLAIQTDAGEFIAHYSEHGLEQLDFPAANKSRNHDDAKPSPQIIRWHAITTKALQAILAGRKPEGMPPLDMSRGTEFQRSVWGELCRIGFGKTKSYAEVAVAIGNPGATRAVGGACGANPIPVLIPCHRVLAANNKLGGFSSGLDWKRKLLARETILFD